MTYRGFALLLVPPLFLLLAACSSGGLNPSKGSPYAPGHKAGGAAVGGVGVGHPLVEGGGYEVGLRAFTRAA
ncbi:MAG: tetratricopeptide repeat protein, partial [Roseobacter sp.]|nr:tetratricopeptide repeat protein [Roseobacter sp.]